MTNIGKKFEEVVKKSLLEVTDISVDRIHDQTNGFKGSANVCDFFIYRYPYAYYMECKTVQEARLPFANISDNQWRGLYEKSKINGVHAGVICWYRNHNTTKYYDIRDLYEMKELGAKSIRFDSDVGITVSGKKKRVFYDYDMWLLLGDIKEAKR